MKSSQKAVRQRKALRRHANRQAAKSEAARQARLQARLDEKAKAATFTGKIESYRKRFYSYVGRIFGGLFRPKSIPAIKGLSLTDRRPRVMGLPLAGYSKATGRMLPLPAPKKVRASGQRYDQVERARKRQKKANKGLRVRYDKVS